MDISVRNLQKKVPLNLRQISRIAEKILCREGVKHASLSIVFVSDHKIRSLNKKYLKRDRATDVLAFDLSGQKSKGKQINGEIVISAAAAVRHAKLYHTELYTEIILYVIHGILHLLGYDDHREEDIKKMRRKEQEIMRIIGI